LSTGETHSVKEFLIAAFNSVDLDYNKYTVINENLFRPAEVDYLRGDSSKAREKLGWAPTYTFDTLVKDMINSDCYGS
jgi:GDPmannose 4,6-dehydratase